MYMVHTSALPFKDNHLQSQVFTCTSTLTCSSDQFHSSWRQGPNHTPRMRTGPSLQQKGPGRETPPLQPQTFALIKIDLGTCYFFVPLNCLLRSQYVQSAGHKDSDIISVYRDLCSNPAGKRDPTPHP